MGKIFYWLKLRIDFFREKRIKKLRRLAGGDTYTIIYLEMLLLSLPNNGLLYFDGVESDFAEEVALEIDESTDNVRVTINYLLAQGLMEQRSECEFIMLQVPELVGSETDSAARKRRSRENLAKKRDNVTVLCDNVTESRYIVQKSNTEIEIEKETEIKKDKELDIETETESQSGTPSPHTDYAFYQNTYNSICTDLLKIQLMPKARKEAVRRFKKQFTDEQFVEICEKAAASDFLSGRIEGKSWKAGFDFLIKPSSAVKVLEGLYDNRKSDKSSDGWDYINAVARGEMP